jgi:hypothetical protein
MRPGLLVALIAAVLGVNACSSGGSKHASAATTTHGAIKTAASQETAGPSATVRDRQVCAAFERFYDTGNPGGTPGAALLARRRFVLSAVRTGHDKALGAAVRAYVDIDMSLPPASKLKSLPKPEIARLAQVNRLVPMIEAKCDALGRHING